MAEKLNIENEMLNTILPGEVTIHCWKVEDGNRTLVEELQSDISEEQFNKALASYRSGEYEYMNQDKRLSALVEEFGGLARLFNDLDEDVEILVDYPEEVRNRRRLTREEIAYYKGEGRIECPEDDYKYVDDIDDIVNRAQYDVMTRAQKRDRYEFENDAEYRLYLITLYDYAQLDEFGDRREPDEKPGMRLRVARLKTGITQTNLANAAGISFRTVTSFERGLRDTDRAQIDTLISLCEVLGCRISDILNDPELVAKMRKLEGTDN